MSNCAVAIRRQIYDASSSSRHFYATAVLVEVMSITAIGSVTKLLTMPQRIYTFFYVFNSYQVYSSRIAHKWQAQYFWDDKYYTRMYSNRGMGKKENIPIEKIRKFKAINKRISLPLERFKHVKHVYRP